MKAKRVWLLPLMLAAACGKGPSEDQCKQLLDHLVDLEFKRAGATAADGQKGDLEKQKATVIENKSPDFIAACMEKTARARVECALAATAIECSDKDPNCASVAKCDTAENQ
jgi:hypothetical protein